MVKDIILKLKWNNRNIQELRKAPSFDDSAHEWIDALRLGSCRVRYFQLNN